MADDTGPRRQPDDFQPDTHFPEDDDTRAGQRRCQGWSRQAGRQCRRNPLAERRFCRFHGGKTKRGTAHPRFKDGRYSTAFTSQSMTALMKQLFGDRSLISLRQDIALTHLRILQAIEDDDREAERKLVDQKRRLVRDEAKRIRDEGHYITAERYEELMRRTLAAVFDVIPPEYYGQVIERVQRIESAGQDQRNEIQVPAQITDG